MSYCQEFEYTQSLALNCCIIVFSFFTYSVVAIKIHLTASVRYFIHIDIVLTSIGSLKPTISLLSRISLGINYYDSREANVYLIVRKQKI